MASHSEENYLKALYGLAQKDGEVNLSDLSHVLNVSKPSVNSMVKNLQQNGWVYYEKYKPLQLTKKGKIAAALVVRKHRLTEMFLVEKMGFGWEEVHDIAEQVEHIKAASFFDRMDELLDYPTVDPHGSPIPNKQGAIIEQNLQALSECLAGEEVILMALKKASNDFLQYLDQKNIGLSTSFKVLSVESFDQSRKVIYKDREPEILSNKVCERLLVQKKMEGKSPSEYFKES